MGAVWESQQTKPEIAILIPTRGFVTSEWAVHFKALQGPPAAIFTERFLPIDISRNTLVRTGLQSGAKRLLFLDDDVIMPPDGLTKLIDLQDMLMKQSPQTKQGHPIHGPVVSALYYAKKLSPDGTFQEGHAAAWKRLQPTQLAFGPLDISKHDGDTLECDVIGAGAMLVHRSVYEAMKPPWFKWNVTDEATEKISEDFYFNIECEKQLGIKPVVASSIKCEHLANNGKVRGDGKMSLSLM